MGGLWVGSGKLRAGNREGRAVWELEKADPSSSNVHLDAIPIFQFNMPLWQQNSWHGSKKIHWRPGGPLKVRTFFLLTSPRLSVSPPLLAVFAPSTWLLDGRWWGTGLGSKSKA